MYRHLDYPDFVSGLSFKTSLLELYEDMVSRPAPTWINKFHNKSVSSVDMFSLMAILIIDDNISRRLADILFI